MTTNDPNGLRPVTEFFPGRSKRWVNESCRAGRIPRAVKVGRTWYVRESDLSAWIEAKGKAPKITAADAAEDLARAHVAETDPPTPRARRESAS